MKLTKKIKLHYKLPTHSNNGKSIPSEKLIAVKAFFVKQYGGLTVDSPSEGYWEDDGFEFHDINVEYSIFIPKNEFDRTVKKEIPKHIAKFKTDFNQLAIFCYYHEVMST